MFKLIKFAIYIVTLPIITLAYLWSSIIRRGFWLIGICAANIISVFNPRQRRNSQKLFYAIAILPTLLFAPLNLPYKNFIDYTDQMELQLKRSLFQMKDVGVIGIDSLDKHSQLTKASDKYQQDNKAFFLFWLKDSEQTPVRPHAEDSNADKISYYRARGVTINERDGWALQLLSNESTMADLFPKEPRKTSSFSPLTADTATIMKGQALPFPKFIFVIFVVYGLAMYLVSVWFDVALTRVLKLP
ncbi:hypothetical protein QTV44_002605 [Vibrio vulnificus]|nr:hypothetical protein [Vibrio vulnificus]